MYPGVVIRWKNLTNPYLMYGQRSNVFIQLCAHNVVLYICKTIWVSSFSMFPTYFFTSSKSPEYCSLISWPVFLSQLHRNHLLMLKSIMKVLNIVQSSTFLWRQRSSTRSSYPASGGTLQPAVFYSTIRKIQNHLGLMPQTVFRKNIFWSDFEFILRRPITL